LGGGAVEVAASLLKRSIRGRPVRSGAARARGRSHRRSPLRPYAALVDGSTRWSVTRRRYRFEGVDEGVAELVRAERHDGTAWNRVLEAFYWWPTHEGREWPALVVPVPAWDGVGEETDPWTYFDAAISIDDRYVWEAGESEEFGEDS
jgi:hypothetical protein